MGRSGATAPPGETGSRVWVAYRPKERSPVRMVVRKLATLEGLHLNKSAWKRRAVCSRKPAGERLILGRGRMTMGRQMGRGANDVMAQTVSGFNEPAADGGEGVTLAGIGCAALAFLAILFLMALALAAAGPAMG